MALTFDNYLFHPSKLGLIMTESRTKEDLSETAKGHLIECYVNVKYKRFKTITNAYLEKGTLAEEDSIDLYALVKKRMYAKNKEVISNDFFGGTPDLYEGPHIKEASLIIDLKTSWDIFTFHQVMASALKKDYFWQLQAYMDLTGAKQARLVYCLVNTPVKLVEDEKKKAMWRMGVIDPDNDEAYQQACQQIEMNAYYDDIAPEERYVEFEIARDDEAIERAHKRVIECRNFLNQLI